MVTKICQDGIKNEFYPYWWDFEMAEPEKEKREITCRKKVSLFLA